MFRLAPKTDKYVIRFGMFHVTRHAPFTGNIRTYPSTIHRINHLSSTSKNPTRHMSAVAKITHLNATSTTTAAINRTVILKVRCTGLCSSGLGALTQQTALYDTVDASMRRGSSTRERSSMNALFRSSSPLISLVVGSIMLAWFRTCNVPGPCSQNSHFFNRLCWWV